ncbi:hypothetical protein Lal_00038185 [Lupinus albus]|nr:hypothetical protein Lal_00038185 [Lupinus albus]
MKVIPFSSVPFPFSDFGTAACGGVKAKRPQLGRATVEAMAVEKMTMQRVFFNSESGGEKHQWRFFREEVI